MGKLLLTARGMDKLEEVAQKYKEHSSCEIELFSDKENRQAISMADIVIFVTSAYKEIVTLSDFKSRTIVCDASAPLNVKVTGSLRPDVFIYHGGIVSLPFEIDPGFDVGLASAQHILRLSGGGYSYCAQSGITMLLGKGKHKQGKTSTIP